MSKIFLLRVTPCPFQRFLSSTKISVISILVIKKCPWKNIREQVWSAFLWSQLIGTSNAGHVLSAVAPYFGKVGKFIQDVGLHKIK